MNQEMPQIQEMIELSNVEAENEEEKENNIVVTENQEEKDDSQRKKEVEMMKEPTGMKSKLNF